MSIIDLHNHTACFSSCSRIGPEELIAEYTRNRIDACCITEHNQMWPPREAKELQCRCHERLRLFFGIEVDTEIGHVLVFTTRHVTIHPTLPLPLSKLYQIFPRSDSAYIWAHPLRWNSWEERYNKLLPHFDAIELYNGNLTSEQIDYTYQQFQGKTNRFTGGSDTHSVSMACRYATQFSDPISSIEDLITALKNPVLKFRPVALNPE